MSRHRFHTAVALMVGACATESFRGSGSTGGSCDDPGRATCSSDEEGVFVRCSDEGQWEPAGLCEGTCGGGQCRGDACESDRCTADGQIEECDMFVGGYFYPESCPPGSGCWDGACRDYVCQPGSISCADGTPFLCSLSGDSLQARQDEPCAEKCVAGVGCQTACEAAEALHTSVGCEFYPFDSDLLDYDDPLGYDLIVANTDETEPAEVEIEVRRADGVWVPLGGVGLGKIVVAAQETFNWLVTCSSYCFTQQIVQDLHPEGTGLFQETALRVTSSRPIVLYQLNADDYGEAASSPGASIVLPRGAIDNEYMALTWPHCGGGLFGGSAENSAALTVIGAEDDTDVTITLSATATTAAGGGIQAYGPGDSATFTIQEGELLQLTTDTVPSDLTGTHVIANKAVSVYAGHEDACPQEGGTFLNDAMLEAMLPLVAWGKEFVAAAAPHGRPYYAQTLWRILASESDTTVEFENPSNWPGVPLAPVTLDEGQFVEFMVTGDSLNPGHFYISSDKPIQPAQALAGETAMVLSVPLEQYLPAYTFLTTQWYYDERLTISRPGGAEVLVDGSPPVGTWFNAGGATLYGVDYEVQQIVVPTDVTHYVTGSGGLKGLNVGITVSGNGGSCSFAYIGGLNQERINVLQ